jgi:HEPN domain-containing protein
MFAASYLQAADFVADGRPKLAHSAPIYFLSAHAVELAFKAFLRSQGSTMGQLKEYGHRLASLMDACRAKRPSIARRQADRVVIEWLGREVLDFRYIRTGFKRMPFPRDVRNVAARLLEATKRPSLSLSAADRGRSRRRIKRAKPDHTQGRRRSHR